MSAYSDWRCGTISDEEYNFYASRERGEDHGEEQDYDEDSELLPEES